MPWGRYSGYFFYAYRSGEKILFGPYDTRWAADDEKKLVAGKTGKVFQRERPVRLW